MIIDGVKMACEACIRGHRVSGCNHSDRKLLPIAKKGRPVSQCNHCRQMRKSRSAHVKCDCGERHAMMKESGKGGKPVSSAGGCHSGIAPAEEGEGRDSPLSCPCCLGGRCTCAIKKEHHLDSVPELAAPATCASTTPNTTATAMPTEVRKPRLQATHSEGSLTTFANGHHRPTHKHHSSIHGSVPYTIPHVGHTGHTFGEHIGGCTKAPVATVSPPASAASQKPRRIKSEHSSPNLRTYPALKMPTTGITPLELTPQPPPQPIKASNRVQPGLSVNTNHPPYSMHEFRSQDLLPSADSERSFQLSAGLQSAGWSPAYGQFGDSTFDDPNSYDPTSQLDMSNYLSFQSSRGLGESVSGDEIDELIVPAREQNGLGEIRTVTRSSSSEGSDQAESDYRISATSSFVTLPPGSLLVQGRSYDEADTLSSSLGPVQPDPYNAGLMIGNGDGQLDNETRGLSLYEGYQDGYLSSKEMPAIKAEIGSLSAPPEEGDFLWMSGWTSTVIPNGAAPVDRWISQ